MRSPDLVPALLFFCMVGCNALLGTDEGSAPPKDDTHSLDAAADDDDDDGSTEKTSPDADAGLENRTDTKPPCTACSPELVANTKSQPKNLRRSGDYLYFSDLGGSYRVDLSKGPCQSASCLEVVSDVNGSLMAVSDSRVCWATTQNFGCAAPNDLTARQESTAIPAGGITTLGLMSKLLFSDSMIYAVRGSEHSGTPETLVVGKADDIAKGTGAFSNVSEPNVRMQAFTLSDTDVAWSQGLNDATVKVKSLKTGDVTTIPLPQALANGTVRDIALYDKYVFMSGYKGDVYRAPIDGSAEAKVHLVAENPGRIVVNASGIYVGFGLKSSSEAEDLEWSPLEPKAPGAAKAKALASPGRMTGLEVAKDGIYYAADAFSGDPAIWRIKFK